MPNQRDLTGQTFGTLTALIPDGHDQHMTTWLCECTCGATVVKRGTYLTSGTTGTCGDRRKHPRAANGTVPADYYLAHRRLREEYGHATDYLCSICAEHAKVWAFMGCDEAVAGPGGTNPYCLHACPDEYQPMCIPCARAADNAVRHRMKGL